MSKTNWWVVATLTLSVVIVLLIVAGWLTLGMSPRDYNHTMPPSWSVWHVLFMPFMLLMPLVWLTMPILGIICMIRWLSGGTG